MQTKQHIEVAIKRTIVNLMKSTSKGILQATLTFVCVSRNRLLTD